MSRRVPFEVVERAAQTAARSVHREMPKGTGFVLIAMTMGADGALTYVSNVNPEDARAVVAEWLATTRDREFTNTDLDPFCWCCGSKAAGFRFRGAKRSVRLCPDCANNMETEA